MNARLERKLQRLAAVIVVGTLSGIAVGLTHGTGATALITGAVYGFLLGAIIGAVELFVLENWDWLNRLSFLANLAVRSAVYAAIIIGIVTWWCITDSQGNQDSSCGKGLQDGQDYQS